MPTLATDLRRALRATLAQRTLTAVAVATLALTIGLNTAVFSIVDAVVFRPLPFRQPDRLIALCERDRGDDADWCGASVPDVADIAERSRTIAVAGIARSWPFIMKTVDGADGVAGGLATPDAFHALGISAALGRLIEPDDLGADWRRVVVLSDDIWRTRFGARRDVIGQSITLDGEPHTIVGVLPPNTHLPQLEFVQIWRPIHFAPRDEERRDWRGFLAFARLVDGATVEQARREVAAIAADIQRQHFPAKPAWTITVRTWQDVVVGGVRRTMYLLLGAVVLVLLIGCANVAHLLLVRGAARQRDLAVRAALGASRRQLARGLLLESLVLAVFGAAGGLLVGWWGARLATILAPHGVPRLDQVALDWRVLAFTAGLSLLTTLLVGTAPALRAARVDLQQTLAEGGRSKTSRRSARLGSALIVAEIAVAVVLVTGAGLLGRSFATLVSWRPGFEQEHLVTAWALASPGRLAGRQQVVDLFVRAQNELATIPSVVSVGSGSAGPLFGGDGTMNFTIDGQPAPAGAPRQAAAWFDIGPTYFRTIGLPMLRGRDIAETDVLDAPLVAVINDRFARAYFAGRDPIGHRIYMVEHRAEFTIVGVVRDVPPVHPGDETPAQIFWSNRQIPRPATYFLVRTAGEPAALGAAIRARLKAVDPEMQVSQIQTMRDWLSAELVRPRFAAVLIGTFGALALVLAMLGTYGLVAYAVAQRTTEIGVRIALGARPAAIVGAVVGTGMRLAMLAVGIGVVGALALTRLLRGLLAGVGATDPLTIAGSVLLLLVAAAVASLVPARRASRVDPMVALRAE